MQLKPPSEAPSMRIETESDLDAVRRRLEQLDGIPSGTSEDLERQALVEALAVYEGGQEAGTAQVRRRSIG